MAVAFRSVSSTTGTDSSGEGTLPGSLQTNDIMLAIVTHNSSSATISTPPSGWDLEIADPNPADFSCWCYKRKYQSGDGNPTWTFSAAGNWSIDIIAYSGADTTTPIDESAGNQVASANTITTTSVSPSVTGCMFVGCGIVDASGAARTWTENGSMTERVEQTDNQLHRVIAEELLSSTSALTRDLTVTGSTQDLAAFAILIRPLSGTQFNQSVDASVSNSVSIIKQAGKIITVANTPTFTKTALVNKALSFSAPDTATIVKQAGKSVSISNGNAVSISRAITFIQSISATVSNAVSIIRQVGKNIAASAGSALTSVRNVDKIISVAGTSAATIQRSINKSIAFTAASITTLTKSVAKTITTAVSNAVSVGTEFIAGGGTTFDQAINATVSSAVSMQRSVQKVVSITSTQFLAIVKDISKTISSGVSNSVQALKSATKIIAITVSSTVTIIRTIEKNINIAVTTLVIISRAIQKIITTTVTTIVQVWKQLAQTISITASTSVSITTQLVSGIVGTLHRDIASIALATRKIGSLILRKPQQNTTDLQQSQDDEVVG